MAARIQSIINDPVDFIAAIIIGAGELTAFGMFVWCIWKWWGITP